METFKHFENDQFLVVWYSKDHENCDNERSDKKENAIEMAERVLKAEFLKCKNRFPDDYMKHTLTGAKIYDQLNRWDYYFHLTINTRGEVEMKKESLPKDQL